MFENDLVELDAAETLAAAEANEHTLITAGTRRLQIAAHWADLHAGDAPPSPTSPPPNSAASCGSDGSAARLIGDALDLRHRLRSIWTAAQAGQVPAYQARHIASATRHLTVEQAGWVDAQLAPSLGAISWGRLQTLLEAKILQADPAGAEQQAAAATAERFVRGWAAHPNTA